MFLYLQMPKATTASAVSQKKVSIWTNAMQKEGV